MLPRIAMRKSVKRLSIQPRPPISNWPVLLSYTVALAIFTGLAYMSFQNFRTIHANEEAVSRGFSVIGSIERSMATITAAEAGHRGYLLTGDTDYLEPYYAARASYGKQFSELRMATDDNPEHQQRLDQLKELAAKKFADLSQILLAYEDGGLEGTLRSLAAGNGHQLTERIRGLHEAMLLDEERLLEHRKQESEAAYRRAIATGFGGGILGLLVVVVSFVLVDRELAARRLAESELRDRTAQLHLLSDVVARVSAARDVRSVSGIALHEVRHLIGAREALIQLRPRGGFPGQIERAVASTEPPTVEREALRRRLQIGARLARDAEFFVIDAAGIRASTADWSPEDRSFASSFNGLIRVPLVGSRRNELGVLQLTGKLEGQFEQRDLLIASQLAQTTGVAIENARLAAALQQSDKRKDEFLAMLGHELRNPLAGILTGIEAIGTDDPDSEAAEIKQVIARQARHMSRIVDDLLDVSRIARGKIRLTLSEVDLIAMVRDVVTDYRQSHNTDRIFFRSEADVDSLAMRGDRTRLAQCISNLIHNGCKFSEDPVYVTVATEDENGKQFGVIRVRDTGVGLKREDFEAIFDSFHQSSATIDRTQGGLGLGLTLVRGLVAMHGGQITASSEGPGRGTEFKIRLPLDPSALRGTWEQGTKELEKPDVPLEPMLVLVIDDRADAILPIRVLLGREGHTVLEAGNGSEGLEIARRERPDIILCDIGLPGGLSGYDVARAIRQEAALCRSYLVAISGYSQQTDRDASAEAGFDYHIAKPVSKAMLKRLVCERPTFEATGSASSLLR